jgi:predicted MFS family arabinose efflux permease
MANFAIWPTQLVITLFLIEIAESFNSSPGVVGQVQTFSSTLAVVSALLMGVLTVRFTLRTLLIVGILFNGLSAIGCYFSTNLFGLLGSYALSGFGAAVILPMNQTLVGELYPAEKRTGVLGLINAGITSSYLVGPPIANYIAQNGGWRAVFPWYVIPVTAVSLILVYMGLPKTGAPEVGKTSDVSLLGGFRSVLSNRSAAWCLAAMGIMMFSWQFMSIYSISYYRERFLISTGMASMVLIVMSICTTSGNLASGRVVGRLGRRTTAFISSIFVAVFLVVFPVVPNLWLSLAGRFFTGLAGPFVYTATSSLALEMVPKFRGVMMALTSASFQMGTALGAALAGMMLLSYSYETVGLVLGAFMFIPIFIYRYLIEEPESQIDDSPTQAS